MLSKKKKKRKDITFQIKSDFLYAVGAIDKNAKSALHEFNELRNQCAHNLNYNLDEERDWLIKIDEKYIAKTQLSTSTEPGMGYVELHDRDKPIKEVLDVVSMNLKSYLMLSIKLKLKSKLNKISTQSP